MREFSQIIYNQIKIDADWKSLTGATSTDPRIYKVRTPPHIAITDSQPAYGVYYRSGSVYDPRVVSFVGRNAYVYVVELYSKKDTTLDSLGYTLEKIFRDKRFTTTNFIVNHTYASRGAESFDDGRKLYFETVTIYLSNIYSLYETS